jgi:hypothetical protein
MAWFAIGQYKFLFLSFTALSFVLFERLRFWQGAVLSVIILVFFGVDVYTIISYTKTAGVCAMGGMLLIIHAMAYVQHKGWRIGLNIAGIILCLVGFMLRPLEFLPCFGLMAVLCLRWLYDLLFTSKLAFEIGWDMPCDISWDENRVLIQAIWLNDLEKFREYESAYGLLPYPMYDESQEKYYTYDDCRHGTFGIPLTSPTENIEKTGLLLEALSADSYHNLIPKYLDSVVTFKLSRDEDSLEMLDYIMDGRVYDIGYAMPDAKRYSWIISEQLKSSKGALASTVEKYTKSATSHYEKLLESYKTMGEMDW